MFLNLLLGCSVTVPISLLRYSICSLNDHFSFMSLCVYVSRSVVSDVLQPHGLQPASLLCPWNSSGNNTGVDCHSLLQRIFPTQGLNSGLLHCRQILYHLSYMEVLAHLKLLKHRYFQGVQFSSSIITPK